MLLYAYMYTLYSGLIWSLEEGTQFQPKAHASFNIQSQTNSNPNKPNPNITFG